MAAGWLLLSAGNGKMIKVRQMCHKSYKHFRSVDR